jgi:hypothetical protein
VLLAVSYSYCYSDTTYGVTNNAAGAGLAWSMYDVLPDATPPWITLEINGLTYRYTMNKDPNADAQVHVRNEDALNGGYVFEETDDWSQLPGGTLQKFYRFPYIDSTRWGDGEMVVEGDGTITDPLMVYNYKMDVNDQLMKCAATPLADPACPGYRDALLEYLKGLTNPSVDDPFYDEWVQAQLDQEVDLEEEEAPQEEKQKEETLEKRMGGKNSVEAMVDTKQQESILAALAAVPKIEPYYTVTIQGGEYEETLKLEDKEIPDNRRALSNLASDAKHKTMVRSQYDREQ